MRTKINKWLVASALALCSAGVMAPGLENIVVEQYHTITAADAAAHPAGGSFPLVAGMKVYRVYVDMAPNYKLNLVFGSPVPVGGGVSPNPLDITTSTTFWNDDNWSTEVPAQTRRLDEGASFDSYITINTTGTSGGTAGCGSSTQQFGVLKTADTDGNLTMCSVYPSFPSGAGTADGNMPGTGPALTYNIGGLMNFQALTSDPAPSGSFTVVDDSWTTLPASTGVDPAGTNRVLIGQFTTSGTFSFHINVQLSSPSSQLETYVWSQAGAGETVSPLLTYPVACTPVQITGTSSNSPICSTTDLTLGVTTTGTAPITYLWTGVGTITNGGTPNASVTGAATGNYNIAVSNACGNANQNVAVVVNAPPTTSTVGGAQTICALGTTTGLGGNTPTTGTGLWSVSGGTGSFSPNASTPNATFTHATGAGPLTLTWTISNSPCTASTANVTVTINQPPTTATVGGAQTICALGTTTGLGGNTPTTGTGLWSVSGGTGSFSPNASTPNATFTHATGAGPLTLTWTISNSPCTASTANVTVTINQPPTTATVGGAQTICALGTTTGLGGNTPTTGTGSWSIVGAGTGTFSPNNTTPNATFTHATGTGTVTLRWTISNPPCTASFANVTVTISPDTDGDGVCDAQDNCPTVFGQIGSSCNDGNALTINDVLNASCVCVGTPVSCVVNGDCNDSNPCTSDACVSNSCVYTPLPDGDGDGVCDAQDNCPTVFGQIGSSCNDGNALTINDVLNASCVCVGTPVACVVNGDCNDSNPCTSDACVSNSCVYTPLPDGDGDGVCDAQDNCPTVFGQIGSSCNDGNALTINDVLNASCVCVGTPVSCVVNGDCNDSNPCTSDACVSNQCVFTPLPDGDGDGVCDAQDNCPTVFGQIGASCNDGNALTINDVLNASCVCVGTPVSCVVNGDCNDSNPCTSDACVSNSCVFTPLPDGDGDGVCDAQDNCPTVFGQIGSSCNDGNALTINDVLNASCVCIGTPVSCIVNGDCNDSNPCTSDACVSNQCVFTPLPDGDGDGVCDAQDNCPTVFGQIGSSCNDGNAGTINDVINASCVCVGTPTGCTEVLFFDITLDNFGGENTVELRDATGTSVIDQAGPFANGMAGTTVTHQFCVPVGCYRLYVMDSGNNGISGGGYVLKNAAGKPIINANGSFSGVSSVSLEFCVPISGQSMIVASCDRTNLLPTTKVYCLTTPGATGYQFWWFDPHGSYSRRILMPINEMKANQVVTNPIPLGLDLNIRVRAQVGGTYTAFGKACRARVNSTGGGAFDDGAQYHDMLVDQATASLELYPNPNRDGMVNLLLSGLSGEAQVVTIEVHDVFGKRVRSEQVTIEGEEFNYVLDLGDDLANGMYMFNVIVGEQMYTQRLLKQ